MDKKAKAEAKLARRIKRKQSPEPSDTPEPQDVEPDETDGEPTQTQ